MTFSQEVKEEIVNKMPESDCCKLARLAGIIKSTGSIVLKGGQITFSCENENEAVLFEVCELISKYFGVTVDELTVNTITRGQYNFEEIEIPQDIGERCLFEIGAIQRNGQGHLEIIEDVCDQILKEDCCKKSFLSGVFLGCGSATDPSGNNSGYHLEFEFESYMLATFVMDLLSEFEFMPKMVSRKDKNVVYFKESDAIFELLVTIGATKSALKLQNERVKRDVNNNINRQANCKTANAEKSAISAVREVVAIQTIATTIGLDGLDARLRVVAEARLNNPELSLNDLLKVISEPLTKSGLRYRLEKIIEIAKDLNGG